MIKEVDIQCSFVGPIEATIHIVPSPVLCLDWYEDDVTLDLLIGLWKGKRACTQHLILVVVTYENLSGSYLAFVTTIISMTMDSLVAEALAQPG